jgi:hypothetical protein
MANASLMVLVGLEYRAVFPGIKPEPFGDLFHEIPTESILTILGHNNALIYNQEVDYKVQLQIIGDWTRRFDQTIQKAVIEAIRKIRIEHGNFVFFSPSSSLGLIEKAFEFYHPGQARDLTIDEELRLFKAFLLTTQEWIDAQDSAFKKFDLSNTVKLIEGTLPILLPHEDHKRFRDFRWQMYKAIQLFNFLEKDETLSKYLLLFYNEFKVHDWRQYLFHLIDTFVGMFKDGNKSVILTKQDDLIVDFFNQISIDTNLFSKKIDYISLREKPVFKLAENKFLVYNYSFFIDKLFNSIQFDFSRILQANDVVTGLPDFKTRYISKSFSEETLFYGLVKYLIGKRKKVIAFNGIEWSKSLGFEGPDYYVRCGNKTFILEFKDLIFKAEIKYSHDFESIKKELETKLVANKKDKQKGVTQLAIWINDLVKGSFKIEDKPYHQENKFYPILVLTDETFNSFGINYYLNSTFESLLSDEARSICMPLTIVHLDIMIELQDLIHDRIVPAHHLLEWYFKFVKEQRTIFDPTLSFSHFIKSEIYTKGFSYDSLPRFIRREVPKVLEEFENFIN